ncbi:YhgE/Pip domain-containing protein [Robertmurraya andreesenii]|uniref:Membrane protein n=1 Tax=Anoxybacillus andreesenii TaxID=1325932 RepID=A0ABT9UYR3_9BACL|nr:YhgE/Pip domain-containing protein [Robertmurraya andreesenii]MDQ0153780.1 putative membrane protein [Robertmurraya andreesenii]
MHLLKEELRHIFTNRKIRVPIIALLFIPVLYSGMFLWAFWDPYAHMDDLPVVIVNEDKGASFEGEHLALGDELVDKLKDSDNFKFDFKSKKDAYKGLKNQDYYLLVEIPDNFSENATTLMDDEPKKLDLVYVPNESYNFLASQIGETAMEKIKASLSEKVTETYADTIFSKITDMADGIGQASDGAGKLSDGSNELKDGTATLHEKLAELASKSIEFKEGMYTANNGSKELASGLNTLNQGLAELGKGHSTLTSLTGDLAAGSQGLADGVSAAKAGIDQINGNMPALKNGAASVEAGAKSLSENLAQFQQGMQSVNAGMTQFKNSMNDVIAQMPPEKQKEVLTLFASLDQLSKSSVELSNGANKLHGGAEQLNKGQEQLAAGIGQLATRTPELEAGAGKLAKGVKDFQAGMKTYDQKFAEAQNGANKLVTGAGTLSGGLNQLADGTDKITSGAGQLEEGAKKIADGTKEVSDGSKELADKLSEGADEATSVHADDKTFNMMASPVKVKNEKINEVPNYGTGFAPYFISLGLFVGALLLSIVFPLKEPAAIPRNAWNWFTSKFTILSAIGIVQGLIAAAVLILGLGLEVKNIPLFLLFVIATSITFVALIQFFVTAFGDPGRFIAILILIFQLTTSAGTFPLEVIPGFLQHFNAFLPMTYTVQGFKAVISSGDYSVMWHNLFILIGFMAIFMIGSLGYFKLMHKRQFKTLVQD